MYTKEDARQEFKNDFLLVAENDAEAYFYHRELVKRLGVVKAGEEMRREFENFVANVAEQEEERGNEFGGMLLKQLLIGWGDGIFYQIAERFIDED